MAWMVRRVLAHRNVSRLCFLCIARRFAPREKKGGMELDPAQKNHPFTIAGLFFLVAASPHRSPMAVRERQTGIPVLDE